MNYTAGKKSKSDIIFVCNHLIVSCGCVVDMEAVVESSGDVRPHPVNRRH